MAEGGIPKDIAQRQTSPPESPTAKGNRLNRAFQSVREKVQQVMNERKVPPISAEALLVQAGMTGEESYYSGLPAMARDIGPDRLMTMFTTLEERNGRAAAIDFARMLHDMPSFAPVHVVRALKELEVNNWIYDPERDKRQRTALVSPSEPHGSKRPVALPQTHNSDEIEAAALGTFVALSGEYPDETVEIKKEFEERLIEKGVDFGSTTIIEG